MSNLSRRSLVTSAAALPVLAVPAVALASVEPDPIYAAIEACLEAERIDTKTFARLEEARECFKAKYGMDEPDAFSKELREGWSKIEGLEDFSRSSCGTHKVVDNLADAMIRNDEDVGKIRPWLHEELDRQTAAFNETVKPLEDAKNEAYEHFDSLFQTLLDTVPTTPAGLAALFTCLRDNDPLREQLGADYDYIDKFVETLATATGMQS
jgi:hypothetical protein